MQMRRNANSLEDSGHDKKHLEAFMNSSCSIPCQSERNKCCICKYQVGSICAPSCPQNFISIVNPLPKCNCERSEADTLAKCLLCHPQCAKCINNTYTECRECRNARIEIEAESIIDITREIVNTEYTLPIQIEEVRRKKIHYKCVNTCPPGHFLEFKEKKCHKCDRECADSCVGPQNSQCLKCRNFKFQNFCLHTCPKNSRVATDSKECSCNANFDAVPGQAACFCSHINRGPKCYTFAQLKSLSFSSRNFIATTCGISILAIFLILTFVLLCIKAKREKLKKLQKGGTQDDNEQPVGDYLEKKICNNSTHYTKDPCEKKRERAKSRDMHANTTPPELALLREALYKINYLTSSFSFKGSHSQNDSMNERIYESINGLQASFNQNFNKSKKKPPPTRNPINEAEISDESYSDFFSSSTIYNDIPCMKDNEALDTAYLNDCNFDTSNTRI